MSNLTRLHNELDAAGIPHEGVWQDSDNSLRVNFKPEATQGQRDSAASIIAVFDQSPEAEAAWQVTSKRSEAVSALDNDQGAFLKLVRALADLVPGEITILLQAVPRPITSITRSGTTATATAMGPHGLTGTVAGIPIFGAALAAYNGVKTITITGPSTFTYSVSGNPTTPAAGSLFYSLSANVPPLQRTFQQGITALKNAVNSGSVD